MSTQDSTNLLLSELKKRGDEKFLDRNNQPCMRIVDDGLRQAWRMLNDRGKPSERMRAFLRRQYRLATNQTEHLDNGALERVLDDLVEDAFRGGSDSTCAEVDKKGDYNFEAVAVFAGTLTKASPAVSPDAKTRSLTYHARTADLWRDINDRKIEIQVMADKKTLRKAINFFSRRLSELRDEFRKEGLDVTITHKQDGSWVTIVRHDDVYHTGPVLVVPDDGLSSSSDSSSGHKSKASNALERTEATSIETEQLKKGDDR